MSISVSSSEIKAKASILVSDLDAEVSELLTQMLQVVNEAVSPTALADTSLTWTLRVGAIEVIAGELIAQLSRRPELQLSAEFGDLKVYPRKPEIPSDPSGLIQKGWKRLKPWLKKAPEFQLMGNILTAPNRGTPGDEQ